jgi:exonuclease III
MDPSSILFWNVLDLNGTARQDVVRQTVISSKIDVVCLQETKEEFSRIELIRLLGPGFDSFIFLPSVGSSGSILIAWRHQLGYQGVFRIDAHSASVQVCPAEGQPWWLTCVYGPQGSEAKIQFLQELREVRQACPGPWLIAGDFNLIYNEEDKNNQNLDRAMMCRFRRWINDLSLKEISLHGRHYTWSNGQSNPTLVKLDRVFCSVEWEGLFQDCLLHSSASQDSDHCPLILGLHDIKRGKKRFHIETFWTKLEVFQEAVSSAWTAVPAGACPSLTLSAKLKATARGLKGWSEKKVGHVASQLELAKELLHQLEVAQDSRTLTIGGMAAQ